MRSLWVAIDSRCDQTRVLATAGPKDTVLKARLSATAHHPRALPTLLEALALWQGTLGLIHSRGHTTRGGYDAKDGWQAGPREACAAPVHG